MAAVDFQQVDGRQVLEVWTCVACDGAHHRVGAFPLAEPRWSPLDPRMYLTHAYYCPATEDLVLVTSGPGGGRP